MVLGMDKLWWAQTGPFTCPRGAGMQSFRLTKRTPNIQSWGKQKAHPLTWSNPSQYCEWKWGQLHLIGNTQQLWQEHLKKLESRL